MSFSVGSYEIIEELGRGGMGVVYKAFEPALQRTVALKMLSDSIAHQPALVQRFYREARAMAALSDANVVQIHSVGEHNGAPYFVMEFIDGESLGERLKRMRLGVPEARRLVIQAARGLAAAHERGLIHRDIKPGNLMLNKRDQLKVTDFGIALSEGGGERLTGTGGILGTPGYLSPEACLGEPLDARTDIFALGIVFFEMLTGRLPFVDDKSPFGLMAAVVQAQIPDVSTLNGQVDPETAALLKRMLARSPQDRQQSCAQLVSELETVERYHGASAMPPATPPRAIPPIAVRASEATPPPLAARPAAPLPSTSYAPPGPPPNAAAGLYVAPPKYSEPHLPPVQKASPLPWVFGVLGLLIVGGLVFVLGAIPDQETDSTEQTAESSEGAVPLLKPLPPLADAVDVGERGAELLGTFTGTLGGKAFSLQFNQLENGRIQGVGTIAGKAAQLGGVVSAVNTEIADDGETWTVFEVQLLGENDDEFGRMDLTIRSAGANKAGEGKWSSSDGSDQEKLRIEGFAEP